MSFYMFFFLEGCATKFEIWQHDVLIFSVTHMPKDAKYDPSTCVQVCLWRGRFGCTKRCLKRLRVVLLQRPLATWQQQKNNQQNHHQQQEQPAITTSNQQPTIDTPLLPGNRLLKNLLVPELGLHIRPWYFKGGKRGIRGVHGPLGFLSPPWYPTPFQNGTPAFEVVLCDVAIGCSELPNTGHQESTRGRGRHFQKSWHLLQPKNWKIEFGLFFFVEAKKVAQLSFFSSKKVSVSQFRSTFSSRCLGMGISQFRGMKVLDGESGSIWLGLCLTGKFSKRFILSIHLFFKKWIWNPTWTYPPEKLTWQWNITILNRR